MCPLALQNSCCASCFCAGGRGAGGSTSKNLLSEAVTKMLAGFLRISLLDESGGPATSSTQATKPRQSAQASQP